MRKTKIICTIGPACEDHDTLIAMCRAGMNVARLNFSHGSHADHQKKIDLLKQVRRELNIPLGILLDTKGPEYRIGTFADGSVTVQEGSRFTFTSEAVEGDEHRVSVSFAGLPEALHPGDRVLVNNGLVVFEVEKVRPPEVICRVLTGGQLSNRKSMSFPGKLMGGPFLSEQDKDDLRFGIQNDVDFIAASFVSTGEDMAQLRKFLLENGGGDIDLIAKIENRSGVDNIEAICAIADGIMIARGDLGVEIPYAEVPAVQKKLTAVCRRLGRRVITATEMLESMIVSPRPTRAEITDVANAVYEFSSAVMLSGETAAGKNPVQAVAVMAHICEITEGQIDYEKAFFAGRFQIQNPKDALSHAACAMAVGVGAKAIAVCDLTGKTAALVSRFRIRTDIIGISSSERISRRLALSWGVIPAMTGLNASPEVRFYQAAACAGEIMALSKGDSLVLVGGAGSESEDINTIRLETVS